MAVVSIEGRRPLPPANSPVVVPPINFSLVVPGIYRSGHPNKKNFSFLRRLDLKGIMYVEGSDDYRKDSMDFVNNEGMQLWRFDLSSETVSPFKSSGQSAAPTVKPTTADVVAGPVLIDWEEDAHRRTRSPAGHAEPSASDTRRLWQIDVYFADLAHSTHAGLEPCQCVCGGGPLRWTSRRRRGWRCW